MYGLPTGTFLIRKAETAPTGNLSLSVRDGETVRHYRIRKLDNGGYFIAARAPFHSLHDLVAHYMEDSDGLVCKLVLACPGKFIQFVLKTLSVILASLRSGAVFWMLVDDANS